MEPLITSSPKNRRRSQRRAPRNSVKAECRKGAYGFGKNLAVQTLDLSESGIRMIVSECIDLATEVKIVIDGYGMNKALKHSGIVRSVAKLENGRFSIGIEFHKQIPYRDWQTLASPR